MENRVVTIIINTAAAAATATITTTNTAQSFCSYQAILKVNYHISDRYILSVPTEKENN